MRTEAVVERRRRDAFMVRDPHWNEAVAGRSRHMHPWACGQPRCFCCHHEKLAKIPDPRDVRQMDEARGELANDDLWIHQIEAARAEEQRMNDLWLAFFARSSHARHHAVMSAFEQSSAVAGLPADTAALAVVWCSVCRTSGVRTIFRFEDLQGIRSVSNGEPINLVVTMPDGWELIAGSEPGFQCPECRDRHSEIGIR
jgi:hypothetical protein